MVQLYEYQKKYLADLPARAIMAADTGTGKTFMALAHYAKHGGRRPLLILAPASKIRTGDWEREIAEFFEGAGDLSQFAYQIYSYEKFSRTPSLSAFKKGKRAVWHDFVPAYNGGQEWAIICDEVHRAKNPQSGIGKRVFMAARDAHFFIGLSATPLPNGWIDFANYSKIWGFSKNITQFKNKYCDIRTFKGFPEIVGYHHEDELAKQWQSISKRLLKKDALDLPDRTFIGVNFKRPQTYLTTILKRVAPDGRVLDTAPALTHALRQTLTAPKLDYLKDLLSGTDENIVVFYNYVTEREAILEMLKGKEFKNKTVFRQDGDKHELPSKGNWADVKGSITLAHYKSGSTGVEMTYATQVIYFSPTYSYAEYLQSIGRVYRNGQESKTTFYNFRTVSTIEEDIYAVLKTKNDFQIQQWAQKLEEAR